MTAEPATHLRDLTPPGEDELLVVVGPTASGKSELALALAEHFDGEVVGADSVQIYRHFDIGSGKPGPEDRARAPHHLVDVVEPLDAYDAARFVADAEAAIATIHARGKPAIVCGGTFLWVKALLFGLAQGPPRDEALRAQHQAFAEAHGRPALHARLAEADPASAARLAPNDLIRVSRALEVLELTGRPQSAWHADHQFKTQRFPQRLLGVARSRDEIDARIAARAEAWLRQGWCDEVRGLVAAGYGEARAMGSVGFRQVKAHLDGELTADELLGAVVRATRTFVRRQRTWLRDQPVTWLAP